MHKIRLYGLVALPLVFGLAACSTSGEGGFSGAPKVERSSFQHTA